MLRHVRPALPTLGPAARLGLVATLLATLVGATAATADTGAQSRASAGAAAAPHHDRLVRTTPSSYTPNVADGRVYAILDLGSKVIVGGSFTQVTSKGSSTVLTRRYLFAFDKATGVVDSGFVPTLDGEVRTLLAGPTSGTVYAGGKFLTVNGNPHRGLTLLYAGTGGRVTSFAPPAINGPVSDLAVHPNGKLLVGGTFTKIGSSIRQGLASLGAGGGALDSYLTVPLVGHHNWDGDGAKKSVGVERFALSPSGDRLVVIGNFKTAAGLARDQIVSISTPWSGPASVDQWQTDSFATPCNASSFDSWVRDIQYAPDGAYVVVAATGGVYPGTLCDTVSKWWLPGDGSDPGGAGQKPAWVTASGGDTFLSTAVTEQAVYVGGHIRWVNNPTGRDAAQPGAIGRASIAAFDPATGLPYTWNPGRNPRGFGVTELYATPDGLWLGYDTDYLGNVQYKRQRIGFFPLSGGAAVPPNTVTDLPGHVYLAAEGTTATDVRVRTYHGPGDVTASQPVESGGTDWRTSRGGFWVGGSVYYGLGDGKLYRRTFDGTTWGTPSALDPYHDTDGVTPDWDDVSNGKGGTYAGANPDFYGAELASVTGMGFDRGRLYYTKTGSSALYWRWFTPSSGAVSAQRFVAATSGFGDVAGAVFVVDDTLYVSRIDGALYQMPFAGGAPSGMQVAVSGPMLDGRNWRARAVYPGP